MTSSYLRPDGSGGIQALGLSSGGLDSILAALILKQQGIDVTWICFTTPFFDCDAAMKASLSTKIPIIIEDITDDYLKMLADPPAGYGKNMNPCMDCHALMFSRAGIVMQNRGFDFLFSGEVAGQRPMSQKKNSLRYIEKKSGFDGYILRPLSGKILPQTIAEQKGFVNRDKLLSISGRSRKVQIKLAEQFGIKDYPAPAGGCLLTDHGFSEKLKDLMFIQKKFNKRDLFLLKYGRHFRLDKNTKIVVGRSKFDNDNIMELYDREKDILIKHAFMPGPDLLIPSGASEPFVQMAASICAGYTKTKPGDPAEMKVKSKNGCYIIKVPAFSPAQFQHMIIK